MRMLPSSQIRYNNNDDNKKMNDKGVRWLRNFFKKNDNTNTNNNEYATDAIATILSTVPKSKPVELQYNDNVIDTTTAFTTTTTTAAAAAVNINNKKSLLGTLQGLLSRLNPYKKSSKTVYDNSVESFSITKSPYARTSNNTNTGSIKLTTPIIEPPIPESVPLSLLGKIGGTLGKLGRNTINGVSSFLIPKSSSKFPNESISTITPTTPISSIDAMTTTNYNILISNEMSQKMTNNYNSQEQLLMKPTIIQDVNTKDNNDTNKKNKAIIVIRKVFPFVSKNFEWVMRKGSQLKEGRLKKILNNSVDATTSDFSSNTYFNNKGKSYHHHYYSCYYSSYHYSYSFSSYYYH